MGMSRKTAIFEIECADDPTQYDRAISLALKALKEDVPRENINNMVSEIEQRISDMGEGVERKAFLEVLSIVHKYCDLENLQG